MDALEAMQRHDEEDGNFDDDFDDEEDEYERWWFDVRGFTSSKKQGNLSCSNTDFII